MSITLLKYRVDAPTSQRRQGGFTLIEVMASVVILGLFVTVIFVSLQGTQQGTLATAKYNQALGLATTISEEIKDGYSSTSKGFSITVPDISPDSNSQSWQSPVPVPLPPDCSGAANNSTSNSATPSTSCPVNTSQPVTLPSGFSYQIQCTMVPGSATDASYTITVTTPSGRTASIQAPVHALS